MTETKPICANCKFWTRHVDNFGSCGNEKFVYNSGGFVTAELSGFIFLDSWCYAPHFATGESFGCIHFQIKLESEGANE